MAATDLPQKMETEHEIYVYCYTPLRRWLENKWVEYTCRNYLAVFISFYTSPCPKNFSSGHLPKRNEQKL